MQVLPAVELVAGVAGGVGVRPAARAPVAGRAGCWGVSGFGVGAWRCCEKSDVAIFDLNPELGKWKLHRGAM